VPVTFTVRLTNTGTVPALPILHAHENGGAGWTSSYVLSSGSFTSNITPDITGTNGQTVTDSAPLSGAELIEAAKAVDVTVTVTPTAALTKRNILLRAFWNPQDPSLAVRDAISLEVAPPAQLVQNGGFEGGIGGWFANGGSVAAETGTVRTGTGAIKATRSQSYQGPAQDLLGRLVPGQTYLLTGWVRTDSTANVKATISYLGTSGVTIFNGVATVNGVSNTGWTQVQGFYRHTEPNGPATVLRLYFETTGSPTYMGPLYLDDASLTLSAPVWTDTATGARGWSTTTSWRSGNAPASFSGNALAFLPAQTVSPGSLTAIQNLGNNFLLNSLTLGGAAPTNGAAAAVGISSNSLAFVENDGAAARLALDATGTNLSYTVSAPLLLSNNLAVAGDGSANFVFNGAVTGTGALTKTGVSVLTLAASNSFSGGTSLDGGTVVASANSALGTGGIIVAGGHLRGSLSASASLPNDLVLSGDIVTGGLLNIDGSVQLSGGNRTVTVDSGTVAWRGPVSDDVARSLVKAGGGTLVLGAVNTYRGNTTINAGALRVNNGAALGPPGTSSAGYTFLAGGSVLATLETTGDMTTDEVFKVAMHNTEGHWQIRNLSGRNVLHGPLLFEGGGSRWDIGSLGGTLELSGVLSNTTTASDTWRNLNLHGPGEGLISGPTADTRSGTNGSLLNIRVNSGTWTMSGPGKDHKGVTTVAGGTLLLDSSLVSPVVVSNGATVGGSGITTTNFTINAGATVLRLLADWNTPAAALGAVRFIGPGNSNWTIRIDGAGLTGFAESNRTVPVFSGALSNISVNVINVAAVNFPGAGTWSVATNSSSLSLLYTAAVQDAYEVWSDDIAWNGRPSGSLDDPDADGLPNLAEYAFGGDPLQPVGAERPTFSLVNDRLTVTFRRIADPALTYEVVATDDMALPGDVIWSSTGAQNMAGPVTVTDTATTQGKSKRFVRIRIKR
jgi:autotransporter-associated beta strand protein